MYSFSQHLWCQGNTECDQNWLWQIGNLICLFHHEQIEVPSITICDGIYFLFSQKISNNNNKQRPLITWFVYKTPISLHDVCVYRKTEVSAEWNWKKADRLMVWVVILDFKFANSVTLMHLFGLITNIITKLYLLWLVNSSCHVK